MDRSTLCLSCRVWPFQLCSNFLFLLLISLLLNYVILFRSLHLLISCYLNIFPIFLSCTPFLFHLLVFFPLSSPPTPPYRTTIFSFHGNENIWRRANGQLPTFRKILLPPTSVYPENGGSRFIRNDGNDLSRLYGVKSQKTIIFSQRCDNLKFRNAEDVYVPWVHSWWMQRILLQVGKYLPD
jgi:hypothetical protein